MSEDDLIRRGDARRVMLAYASSYSAEEAETAIRTIPATDARADALREAAAAVRARYMGDNNREDQEVLRCEAAILALIDRPAPHSPSICRQCGMRVPCGGSECKHPLIGEAQP